jgi:hypothetical protein
VNPVSEDILDMLEAESGLSFTIGTDLFLGKEPNLPHNCATVFDTPGYPPQLTIAGNEDYFYPSIQIRVRNSDYRNGWDLANDIRTALHGRNHEVWNGTTYSVIRCTSGPFFFDWDENSRFRFVVSFDVQRS